MSPPALADADFRRWTVFVHQDGVILGPTVAALAEIGILEPSLVKERSLAELAPDLPPGGFANLRVGLRSLAGQGWLAEGPTLDPATTVLRWTDSGRAVMRYRGRYVEAGRLLGLFPSNDPEAWAQPWDADQRTGFAALVPLACEGWRLDDLRGRERALTATHLDAALVVPALLRLRAHGDEGTPELPDDAVEAGVGRLLAGLGLTRDEGGPWTDTGRAVVRLSVHFGMAASYLPLLARLAALYRGEATVGPEARRTEWHVQRRLNISASAAAHTRYFEDADRIFVELFDREPLDAQPRFIADMGCGDASWLVHLHELIATRTLRGRHLDDHPLLMVGLDYNGAALEQGQRVVDAARLPSLLLHGDVSDPDAVAATLAKHGVAMEDGLHVRAFIDHDRAYRGGDPATEVRGTSTGAYVDRGGAPLRAADVERDLVAHLRRWAPHVRRHGIVMLEAHCVAPWIARKHLGATHSVAFDAYHGYSHQYPIEHAAFLECCRKAGLRPASESERRYPATRPFVAVSLNRLLMSGPDAPLAPPEHAAPEVDLEDGRALHRLLYVDGDVRYPRAWCSAPTGAVVAGALEVVERRLADARAGDTVRVLDYGAGTGLATIELLKAVRERGIEERLRSRGVELELHLVDLPSSWFAQGEALLRGHRAVRFHSLLGASGGFRPLLELTGDRRVDVVMANMVFHLIPAAALPRAAVDLTSVTAAGGRLVWNAPDLGPAGPYAVLFHDANRALRRRWLELLRGEPGGGPHTAEAVELVRAELDDEALRAAQARADRRVLPRANAATEVAVALADAFGGEATVERPTYELLAEDVVDTLLVPSNQEEFLSELRDRALRERVIAELMLGDVLPELQGGPAGTAEGLNVQWTLGSVVRAA